MVQFNVNKNGGVPFLATQKILSLRDQQCSMHVVRLFVQGLEERDLQA